MNNAHSLAPTALENNFPIEEISRIAKCESWRKEIYRPATHIHKWWAIRLGSVFRAIVIGALSEPDKIIWDRFYEPPSLEGRIVLDPFMGSGTTLGEAMKLGAQAIGCDINPVSTFLVTQSLKRVDIQELEAHFNSLTADIEPILNPYYSTTNPATGELCRVLYFFWVKELTLPDGTLVPLFNSYVFAKNAYPKKKPLSQILCRGCGGVFKDLFDANTVTCPQCDFVFDPNDGPVRGTIVRSSSGKSFKVKDLVEAGNCLPKHRLYAILAVDSDGQKFYKAADSQDIQRYEDAETELSNSALPLPEMPVRPGYNTNQARGYGYFYWRDFFCARQLFSLGTVLKRICQIEDRDIREQFLCLFSSTLEFNNMFCSFKGEGTGAVRHMFSHHILKPERTPLENTVLGTRKSSGTFTSLFYSRLLPAKKYLDAPFELELPSSDLFEAKTNGAPRKRFVAARYSGNVVSTWNELKKKPSSALILNGDSSFLPIPDKSVDAVVTDPPYFDFVHYSELSDFFFAWLSPILGKDYKYFQKEDSSDAGEVQTRDPEDFGSRLARVFEESHRVLQDNGVLVFTFHHSRPEGWKAIYHAIQKANFVISHTFPVRAEMAGTSPKNGTKAPIHIDAVLVCRKQFSAKLPTNMTTERQHRLQAKYEASLLVGEVELSPTDRFVIRASLAATVASQLKLSSNEFEATLKSGAR